MLQIKSPANPPMIVIINVTMNHQPKGFQPFVLSKLRKTKNPITPPQIIPRKTYIKGFFEFIILRGHNALLRRARFLRVDSQAIGYESSFWLYRYLISLILITSIGISVDSDSKERNFFQLFSQVPNLNFSINKCSFP